MYTYVYMHLLTLKCILFGIYVSPCRIYGDKLHVISAFTLGLPQNQNLPHHIPATTPN